MKYDIKGKMMKYLAVIEYRDQSYSLEDVLVVSGIDEVQLLVDEREELDDSYAYNVSFFPFEDPESVIKKFEYPDSYSKTGIAFYKHGFLDFLKNFDHIVIPEMNIFESTGLYRRKSGFCIKCGRENLQECKCKLTKDIGLTIIKTE